MGVEQPEPERELEAVQPVRELMGAAQLEPELVAQQAGLTAVAQLVVRPPTPVLLQVTQIQALLFFKPLPLPAITNSRPGDCLAYSVSSV